MKKLFFISWVLLVLLLFSACRSEPYTFKQPIDEIENIEIVSTENSLEFTVIKTLSETERSDFLSEFQEIEFETAFGDPDEVFGDAIKFNYKNGDYEIVCFRGGQYINDGTIKYNIICCDEEQFKQLINNYLAEFV